MNFENYDYNFCEINDISQELIDEIVETKNKSNKLIQISKIELVEEKRCIIQNTWCDVRVYMINGTKFFRVHGQTGLI